MQQASHCAWCRRIGSHQDLPYAVNTIRQRILVSVLRMTNKKIAIQDSRFSTPG